MNQRDITQFKQFVNFNEILSSIQPGQIYWVASSIFNLPADLSGPFTMYSSGYDNGSYYISCSEDNNVFSRHYITDICRNNFDAIFTSQDMAIEFVNISKRIYESSTEWQELARAEQDAFCANLDSDWTELDD
jgi:hypothetical protein